MGPRAKLRVENDFEAKSILENGGQIGAKSLVQGFDTSTSQRVYMNKTK